MPQAKTIASIRQSLTLENLGDFAKNMMIPMIGSIVNIIKNSSDMVLLFDFPVCSFSLVIVLWFIHFF